MTGRFRFSRSIPRRKHARIAAALTVLLLTGRLGAAPLINVMQVDTSAYPDIRLILSEESPHPHFIETNSDTPSFAVQEIYNDAVFTQTLNESAPPRAIADRLSLVLVLDATKSVPEDSFRSSLRSAESIVHSLKENDQAALYVLRGEPQLLVDFTTNRDRLLQQLDGIERDGRKTRLYDSLYSGIYSARSAIQTDGTGITAGLTAHTAVVLLTDSRDEGSYLTDNDCFELTRIGLESRVPVHVILHGGDEQRDLLQRLAYKSGGQLLQTPNRSQLEAFQMDLRRLPRRIHYAHFQSQLSHSENPLPGESIVVRVVMKSNEAEYAGVSSYRVPFTEWVLVHMHDPMWLALAVALLLCVFLLMLLLIIMYVRRYHQSTEHRRVSEQERDVSYIDNIPVPPPPPEDLPEKFTVPTAQDYIPAGVLMDNERTLYMREYAYRLLQMALRDAEAYQKGRLITDPGRGKAPRREYDLFLENTIIGTGRWANIPVNDPAVSPVHARVKKVDNRFVIYDLLSAGGVYLNGRKVLRPRGLNDGDEIRIGHVHFIFQGE